LSENINTYLSSEGYVCEQAYNCRDAIIKLSGFEYDIVVLDIMLPDGDGLEVLQYTKDHKSNSGVLIISAKNALDDKVKGLDLGADDYLTKPFHLPELNARLKALYRRKNFEGSQEIAFEEIRIHPDQHEVKIGEAPVNLTGKEYELLIFFLANKNRVLTRQSIAEHLWGDSVDLLDSFDFVYQHIKNLRKKMVQAGGSDYVDTIYGLGYKFNTSKA